MVHERTGMCDQDGVVYSCKLTGNYGKTEIKNTINNTVVREGILDREHLWLHPNISGSKLQYAEFHVVAKETSRYMT